MDKIRQEVRKTIGQIQLIKEWLKNENFLQSLSSQEIRTIYATDNWLEYDKDQQKRLNWIRTKWIKYNRSAENH